MGYQYTWQSRSRARADSGPSILPAARTSLQRVCSKRMPRAEEVGVRLSMSVGRTMTVSNELRKPPFNCVARQFEVWNSRAKGSAIGFYELVNGEGSGPTIHRVRRLPAWAGAGSMAASSLLFD